MGEPDLPTDGVTTRVSDGSVAGGGALPAVTTWLTTVVALTTVVTLELVRSTGPLLDLAYGVSVVVAAMAALGTYLGAGLIGLLLGGVARRRNAVDGLVIGVMALVLVRLVVQGATGIARFFVGLGAISLSIAVLTFAVAVLAGRTGGGAAAASAVALGGAAGVGLQLAFGTWDAYWRHDLLGWSVTVAVLVALGGAAVLARLQPGSPPTHLVSRLWVLGPALGLMVMVTTNSGFAASQSGIRLAIAGPVVGGGLLFAGRVGAMVAPGIGSSGRTAVAAAVPAASVAGVFGMSGAVVLGLLVAAQLAMFAIVAVALEREGFNGAPREPRSVRAARATSLVGVGAILPLLVFQLDYDIPLGFPNELVIVAAALVLGAAGLRARAPAAVRGERGGFTGSAAGVPRGALVGAVAVVLVGGTVAVAREIRADPRPGSVAAGELTLVSWNLHYGVDPDAGVDLEEIARTIERQAPAIVALQEVSRGWVMGGGTDMATWLGQRLDMHVAFAPAADRQFGNAVLTALPRENVTVVELPYGNGPQERSAIVVDVLAPDGPIRVTSVHLQNKSHVPTRLGQIDAFLTRALASPRVIVAGDFNAQPGSPEIERMLEAGLASAQDVSGDPTALTDPSTAPDKRIDWVFGRGVSFLETDVLADALSSDHLPLVVRFTLDEPVG